MLLEHAMPRPGLWFGSVPSACFPRPSYLGLLTSAVSLLGCLSVSP